jgi:hypothetical protein
MIQQLGEPADGRHNQLAPAPRMWNWPAFVSFLLAVLGWIGQVDSITISLRYREFLVAWVVFAVYSAVVLVPYYFGRRRWRRAPDEWTGRGYLATVAVILILNTVWMVFYFGVALLHGR